MGTTNQNRRLRRPSFVYDVELLRVMADESRQKILQFLCTPGAGEMLSFSVTEIAENTGLSKSTASHHLQILLRADMVIMEKAGRERNYRFHYDKVRTAIVQFRDLIRFIDDALERYAPASK